MFAKIFQFSYLLPTLQSLISGMNAEERASTLLVVLIADDEGPHSQFVAEQLHSVRSEFSQEIDSGLLHVSNTFSRSGFSSSVGARPF